MRSVALLLLLFLLVVPTVLAGPPPPPNQLAINEETNECKLYSPYYENTINESVWTLYEFETKQIYEEETLKGYCVQDMLNVGESFYRCLSQSELWLHGCFESIEECYQSKFASEVYPHGYCIDTTLPQLKEIRSIYGEEIFEDDASCQGYAYIPNVQPELKACFDTKNDCEDFYKDSVCLPAHPGQQLDCNGFVPYRFYGQVGYESEETCKELCEEIVATPIGFSLISDLGVCTMYGTQNELTCCEQLGYALATPEPRRLGLLITLTTLLIIGIITAITLTILHVHKTKKAIKQYDAVIEKPQHGPTPYEEAQERVKKHQHK